MPDALTTAEAAFTEAWERLGFAPDRVAEAAVVLGYEGADALRRGRALSRRASVVAEVERRQAELRGAVQRAAEEAAIDRAVGRVLDRMELQVELSKIVLGEIEGTKVRDRLKAIELLLRTRGEIVDRIEVSGQHKVSLVQFAASIREAPIDAVVGSPITRITELRRLSEGG